LAPDFSAGADLRWGFAVGLRAATFFVTALPPFFLAEERGAVFRAAARAEPLATPFLEAGRAFATGRFFAAVFRGLAGR
jgi:hypothetical protein